MTRIALFLINTLTWLVVACTVSSTPPGPSKTAPPGLRNASEASRQDDPPPQPRLEEASTAGSYPFQEPLAAENSNAPAMRYANLSPGACRAELQKRKLTTRPARRPAQGVATPLRLSGPVRSVEFVAPGARSVYGTLDCRLVLALDELARVLEQHQVVKVHIDNLYRPRAHLPGTRKRSQHAYGLAVDVRALELADGRLLLVERDWFGLVASPPCGPASVVAARDDGAIALRNIICDVVRQGVFHHVLTPSYDAAHRDHVHLDIKRDARTIVVR